METQVRTETPTARGDGPGAEPHDTSQASLATGIWSLSADEVFERLQTSPRGLTEDEAFRRLKQYGRNTLPAKVGRPIIFRFFDQFKTLFAIMLEAAAVLCVIAAALSHGSDRQDQINVAIAIVGVVLLNATIGFFQEYRAEKATEALQKMVPANAKVVRDGEVTIVAVADLVPGDLVQLEEGDSISADARLIRQYEMSTINIALTGESDAVRKTHDSIVDEQLASINMPNLVFMGTSVASGTGQAVVFATGLNTEFGHIFTLTGGVSDEKSPLQREIDAMARTVSIIAVFCGIALFFAALLIFKFGAVPALLFALGVMVALVPEGLPATLSVALAIGVQRMAKENALIKKLMGVETLGSTNVICTDKTGTLTKAEMTVREMFAGDTVVEVTGAGYEPVGDFVVGDTTLPKDEARRRLDVLLRAMSFANDAKVLPPADDKGWRVIGDPTEGCLLVAAQKVGFDLSDELIERPKIYELPFESVRKRMSVVHVEGDGQKAFVKGAPSETIPRCTSVLLDGKVVPMTDERRESIVARNDDMSRQALRVLAIAERDLPVEMTEYTPDSVESELTFLGLVGMIDPPRPEVSEAVEHALTAGIRIIMVTGDYGLTAEAIARRIGIVRGDRAVRVITGTDLQDMTDDDLKGELGKPQDVIFARVAPEHKMMVVSALKEMKQIVAVTGDGVNDAPALEEGRHRRRHGHRGHRRGARGGHHDPARRQLRQHHQGGRAGPRRLRQRQEDDHLHLLAQHGRAVPLRLRRSGRRGPRSPGRHPGPVDRPRLRRAAGSRARHRAPRARRHEAAAPPPLRAPAQPQDVTPCGVHRRHRVVLGRGRLSVCASCARLDLGRRLLDEPLEPALHVLARGHHHDPGGDRHVPGRQRLRLPHRARVAVQGRHLQ